MKRTTFDQSTIGLGHVLVLRTIYSILM